MKPTYGLVPYTGCMPLDMNMDHIGPMTNSVEDNALLLEVIAGSDGIDPRQRLCTTQPYLAALGKGISGMRFATVEEGFSQEGADPAVSEKVLSAVDQFTGLGAVVEQVSIPMHLLGPAIFLPSAVRNFTDIMLGRGGLNTEGQYVPSMVEATARWRERPDELPHNVKILLMAGHYLQSSEGREVYAKAKNLSNQLRALYDQKLSEYDLLLMPTTITTAPQLPPADAPCEVVLEHALGALANTLQFDLTGHPAMSIPCGMIDGLPVGMMLIGRHLDESTIYRAAHAFEQSTEWKNL
jgi:amidase